MVYKLQRTIYRLKQVSRSWNIIFDQAMETYGFEKYIDEPCVYKKEHDKDVVFLILYIDDILLIYNDLGVLSTVEKWLVIQFEIKDFCEVSYVLGIKLL